MASSKTRIERNFITHKLRKENPKLSFEKAWQAAKIYLNEEGAVSEEEAVCIVSGGHTFIRTGTAFGGDDERWGGEGRSYCTKCGADGDG